MTLKSLFTTTFFYPNPVEAVDLTGKVALVTGANTGIGKETAILLAQNGAKVFCLGRSKDKTEAAVTDVKVKTGNESVFPLICDLQDLQDVEQTANNFLKLNTKLNILVNNAGIYGSPFSQSRQGIEAQFATNHFAHVVLTELLLDRIIKSQPSRIVNVSSFNHVRSTGIPYESFNDKTKYDGVERYCDTKLANMHYTANLNARLEAKGVEKVFVTACHPGLVKTAMAEKTQEKEIGFVNRLFLNLFQIKSEWGAITPFYCASSLDIEKKNWKGKYFVPYSQIAEPSKFALDIEMIKKTTHWTKGTMQERFKKSWDYYSII